MEFSGEFDLEGVTGDIVWLGLSDPYLIKNALPGCQFIAAVEDADDVDFDALREASRAAADPPVLPEADIEAVTDRAFEEGQHYATRMEIALGSVNPRFETVLEVTERAFPTMRIEGGGSSQDGSFEMEASMHLEEGSGGVTVTWEIDAEIGGRIARMGERVLGQVAKRVIRRFFNDVEAQLKQVGGDPSAVT